VLAVDVAIGGRSLAPTPTRARMDTSFDGQMAQSLVSSRSSLKPAICPSELANTTACVHPRCSSRRRAGQHDDATNTHTTATSTSPTGSAAAQPPPPPPPPPPPLPKMHATGVRNPRMERSGAGRSRQPSTLLIGFDTSAEDDTDDDAVVEVLPSVLRPGTRCMAKHNIESYIQLRSHCSENVPCDGDRLNNGEEVEVVETGEDSTTGVSFIKVKVCTNQHSKAGWMREVAKGGTAPLLTPTKAAKAKPALATTTDSVGGTKRSQCDSPASNAKRPRLSGFGASWASPSAAKADSSDDDWSDSDSDSDYDSLSCRIVDKPAAKAAPAPAVESLGQRSRAAADTERIATAARRSEAKRAAEREAKLKAEAEREREAAALAKRAAEREVKVKAEREREAAVKLAAEAQQAARTSAVLAARQTAAAKLQATGKCEAEQTFYHGTSLEAGLKIQEDRWKPSSCGLLGPGVYVTGALAKAMQYAGRNPNGGVILTLKVDMGRIKHYKKGDSKGDPRAFKNWTTEGYDSAHAAAGVLSHSSSALEEFCISDPKRITLTGAVLGDTSAADFYIHENKLCRKA
jgi:hypothetical protein